VGKIVEKAVCRSVILTIWHCILSADLSKAHSFRLLFLAILPTGKTSMSTLHISFSVAISERCNGSFHGAYSIFASSNL